MNLPRRISMTTRRLSPWVVLTEREFAVEGMEEPQVFHSFNTLDYVSILAISQDGRIPLVQQFRPALERVTLELPGGLLDHGESPEDCARRELMEETGFVCGAVLHSLPPMVLDTGRLENRANGFVALDVCPPDSSWRPEQNVEVVTLTKQKLLSAVNAGQLEHAGHIAIIGLAVLNGYLNVN